MSAHTTDTAAPAAPRSSGEIESELASLLESPVTDDSSQPAADPAIAAATLKGWVPKDQYKGDPAKWVDASLFIDRGERFNHNLQREVSELKRKLDSFEGTKIAFKKFHEETLAAKDVELKTAIGELRLQRSQAIREGDDEVAIQLEDRIDLLKEEQRSVKALPASVEAPPANRTPGPNPEDPVLLEWIEDGNDWFQSDPKLRDYAVALGEDLIKGGITIRGRKFLDLVAEKMAEEFPRRFKAPVSAAMSRQNPVEGSTRSPAASRSGASRNEADLPPEDRALMTQFIKEGWTTKDAFLKSYFSRNA